MTPRIVPGLLRVTALLLVLAVLLLPQLVPTSVREPVVGGAAILSLLLAAVLQDRKTPEGLILAGFCLVVIAAWLHKPFAAPESLRHFAGLAAQVLLMAVLVVWCRGEELLVLAAAAFAVVAAAALVAGVLSSDTADNLKLRPFLPKMSVPVTIPIDGTDGGRVNPNAVAGTAVLVLPVVLAVAVLPRSGSRLRSILRSCGFVATSIALALVLLLASRSAWAALSAAGCALLYRRLSDWRLRLTLGGVLISVGVVTVWALFKWHPPLAVRVHELPELNWINTYTSFAMRIEVWRDALIQLRQAPLLGIGINAFHSAHLGPPFDRVSVMSHAHNIFLQVALDLGIVGLLAYVALFGWLGKRALEASYGPNSVARRIALGAGLALLTVHVFGLGDAIALGAKVGVFQWAAAGLVLLAWRLQQSPLAQAQPS